VPIDSTIKNINVSDPEKIKVALDRLSVIRLEASEARNSLTNHEGKIEEALVVVDLHQRDVEREAARLATLENEIGDIRLALFKRGVLRTH
jgi:hypothetical protein